MSATARRSLAWDLAWYTVLTTCGMLITVNSSTTGVRVIGGFLLFFSGLIAGLRLGRRVPPLR